MLTREVLKYKGQISDLKDWDVPVTLFLNTTVEN